MTDTPERLPDAEFYVATLPASMSQASVRDAVKQLSAQWREEMGDHRKLLILGAGVTIAPLSHLDAAWRQAEAALKDGWALTLGYDGMTYTATAGPEGALFDDCLRGYGDTPAEALFALTAEMERA